MTGKQEVIPSNQRKLAFSPGGQKGFLHGGRKCMNRMPKKFAPLPVSPVYLLSRRKTTERNYGQLKPGQIGYC